MQDLGTFLDLTRCHHIDDFHLHDIAPAQLAVDRHVEQSKIAAVLGQFKGTFYYYFKSKPNVLEAIVDKTLKGQRSRAITAALSRVVRDKPDLLDVTMERAQAFPNKYDEAEALAVEFPALEPYLPKRRRLWDTESPRTILFEAVALAKLLFVDPTPVMARAMG